MGTVKIPAADPATGKIYADVDGTGSGGTGLDLAAAAAMGFRATVKPFLSGSTYTWPGRPVYAGPVDFVDNPPPNDAGDPGNTGSISGGGGLAAGAGDLWIEFS